MAALLMNSIYVRLSVPDKAPATSANASLTWLKIPLFPLRPTV